MFRSTVSSTIDDTGKMACSDLPMSCDYGDCVSIALVTKPSRMGGCDVQVVARECWTFHGNIGMPNRKFASQLDFVVPVNRRAREIERDDPRLFWGTKPVELMLLSSIEDDRARSFCWVDYRLGTWVVLSLSWGPGLKA